MKNIFTKIFATFICVIIILSTFTITCFAEDSGVLMLSTRAVKTGENVTVTVKYNSTDSLKSINGALSFDSKLFEYVSGGTSVDGDEVKISENITNNSKQQIYQLTFKAISPGNALVSFSLEGLKVNGTKGKVAQGASLRITGAPIKETEKKEAVPANTNLTVSDNETKYNIINDIKQIPLISNFKRSITSYKGEKINTVTDKFNEYVLFYLQDDTKSHTKWFYLKDDQLLPLNYITFNNDIYIIESSVSENTAPEGNWKSGKYLLSSTDTTVDCYESTKTILADFKIFLCYYGGERGYYRYDTKTNVLQRDPEFALVSVTPKEETSNSTSIIGRFNSMSYVGKLILFLTGVEIIAIVVLISLLIVRKKNQIIEEDIDDI